MQSKAYAMYNYKLYKYSMWNTSDKLIQKYSFVAYEYLKSVYTSTGSYIYRISKRETERENEMLLVEYFGKVSRKNLLKNLYVCKLSD